MLEEATRQGTFGRLSENRWEEGVTRVNYRSSKEIAKWLKNSMELGRAEVRLETVKYPLPARERALNLSELVRPNTLKKILLNVHHRHFFCVCFFYSVNMKTET